MCVVDRKGVKKSGRQIREKASNAKKKLDEANQHENESNRNVKRNSFSKVQITRLFDPLYSLTALF